MKKYYDKIDSLYDMIATEEWDTPFKQAVVPFLLDLFEDMFEQQVTRRANAMDLSEDVEEVQRLYYEKKAVLETLQQYMEIVRYVTSPTDED